MEFRDLKAQYAALKAEIDAAMIRVAADSHYIMGPDVKELEDALAKYVGVPFCKSCANGTDALTLALKVWGIGPGDAVFVPDFTFFSSAEVVSLEGATPIFVDVRKDSFNIDPHDLEKAIEEVIADGKLTPRVIIGVDLFGRPAPWDEITAIARKYDLLTLEDAAQGFGGRIGDRRACSFGDISTTSFFPAKPVGCYGDGGAVFTDNPDWATLIESYRVHGKGAYKYDNVRIGLNSRLDTLQAAILSIKLRAFESYELDDVNNAAKLYDSALAALPLELPSIPQGWLSSWAQYTVILPSRQLRDGLQAFLKEKGIPSMVYYPTPMSGQTAFKSTSPRHCPVAADLCGRVLSLPVHPYISEDDIRTVADTVSEFFAIQTRQVAR